MNARVTPLPEYTPANWDAEVGKRIKELLIGRATQEKLGGATGLGQSDISKRLNGRVQWKGRELSDIAEALGVSIAVLYGESTPSTMPPSGVPTIDPTRNAGRDPMD